MKVPIEISYRGIENKEPIEELIYEKARKLETKCDHIASLRIAIECDQSRNNIFNIYRARLDINIPPSHTFAIKEISSKKGVPNNIYSVIRKAFHDAERKVTSIKELQQGKTKVHPYQETQAVVTKLYFDKDYGFIRSINDGLEIYFHKHSVLNDDFTKLAIGTGVSFKEEYGEKGPQATFIKIVDNLGVRRPQIR